MHISASDFLHDRPDLISRETLELLASKYFGNRARWIAHITEVANRLGIPNYVRRNPKQLSEFLQDVAAVIRRALHLKEQNIREADEVLFGDTRVIVRRINYDWMISMEFPDGKRLNRTPILFRKDVSR